MRLHRSLETPSLYTLLVQWETVDDHAVGFRQSTAYAQWRSLVSHCFAEPPHVGHAAVVVEGFGKPA